MPAIGPQIYVGRGRLRLRAFGADEEADEPMEAGSMEALVSLGSRPPAWNAMPLPSNRAEAEATLLRRLKRFLLSVSSEAGSEVVGGSINLAGWTTETRISRSRGSYGQHATYFIAPNGRRMSSQEEVAIYLGLTAAHGVAVYSGLSSSHSRSSSMLPATAALVAPTLALLTPSAPVSEPAASAAACPAGAWRRQPRVKATTGAPGLITWQQVAAYVASEPKMSYSAAARGGEVMASSQELAASRAAAWHDDGPTATGATSAQAVAEELSEGAGGRLKRPRDDASERQHILPPTPKMNAPILLHLSVADEEAEHEHGIRAASPWRIRDCQDGSDEDDLDDYGDDAGLLRPMGVQHRKTISSYVRVSKARRVLCEGAEAAWRRRRRHAASVARAEARATRGPASFSALCDVLREAEQMGRMQRPELAVEESSDEMWESEAEEESHRSWLY